MEDAESNQPVKLLTEMESLRGRPCTACARMICGHEAVISIVLGFKNATRCLPCFAAALKDEIGALRARLVQHIRHRDCYLHGWLMASAQEGFGTAMHPPCLFPPDGQADITARGEGSTMPNRRSDIPTADAEWDAGDMGCGDLVLELRLRLKAMAPGRVLKVTARDPGAPADLPAWCGMTGHLLLKAQHPEYWIRRRED